jgi:hypothetical protein
MREMSWHHKDCEGQCLACLIQNVVKQAYGNQGLAYLLRNVEQQKNEYICKCGLRVDPHRCRETGEEF